MGTTLGKKEEVKKSVRAKKVTAVKRVTKKPVAKKVAENKAKDIAKVTVKKTASRAKKTSDSKVSSTPEVVFVPGQASLRLLEKVHLYTVWYEQYVPSMMSGVAKVGGYAFIFLGTVFAVFSYIDAKNIIGTPAALICSGSECMDVPDDALPITAPKITFLNSIPATLNSDTDFKITALNTTDPTITLTAIETGNTVILEPADRQNESEYRFLIPAGHLSAATYKIEATVQQNATTYTFAGPVFAVNPKELPEAVAAEVTTAVAEETVPAATAEGSEVITSNSDLTSEISTSSDEEELVDTEPISTTRALSPISITLHDQPGSSYVKILTGDFTPSKVDVYSQLYATGQPLYLGQATLVQGEWVFNISALNLPQASHYLYASFAVTGKTYKTEAVKFEPITENLTSPNTETDLAVLVQKIELALLASSVDNNNRQHYFDFFTTQPEILFTESEELLFANKDLLSAIDNSMEQDVESLNPLLLQYAAATQAESQFITTLSNQALTDHYTKLASIVASLTGEPSAVPSIHTVMALRYQILKDKVRESEEQIKQDTNNLTTKDSDQDGVSDFDEVANFATNPLLADTDNDGVVDSVELIRNSDPLVVNQIVVPNLNKNIEEVTFDSVVEIDLVSPLVAATNNNEPEEYFVTVEGRSIPNSYVYLLSHTTDVVGIVKTGSTGLFSYTFEQNFNIGEHQITAVLTDVTGEIVASSKPHSFARTQNTFVAAATMSTATPLNTESNEDNVLLNLLVAAVGVITFGFVLLLLSSTLRNRHQTKTRLA